MLILGREWPLRPIRVKEFLPAVARRIPLCDGDDVGVIHSCWQASLNSFFVGCSGGGRMVVAGAVFARSIVATLGRGVILWHPTVTAEKSLSLLRDTTAIR